MSLNGTRVWLSGSIPKEAEVEQRERIFSFVRLFAKEIFRQGGVVLHGSHPPLGVVQN
ncbi:MAG: hypothetical protein AB4372_39715 [Xenococcus sp. (in: cyanobacteria)]